ncbi:MAG: addiction module component CHP02574 family protein [Methylobacter sp.]|nr:MAG: addiction module component CHP02574 family protein [Methylobacter sp.]
MHITEIKSLPIEQRMLLMEQIWDTLCYENEEIKSPSWHEDIINDRMQLVNSGKAKFISIQELKDKNS